MSLPFPTQSQRNPPIPFSTLDIPQGLGAVIGLLSTYVIIKSCKLFDISETISRLTI